MKEITQLTKWCMLKNIGKLIRYNIFDGFKYVNVD